MKRVRVLPRSAFLPTQHALEGCRRRGRFWRYVAQRRPLPPGFVRGLTQR